jgi:hypothetical protein
MLVGYNKLTINIQVEIYSIREIEGRNEAFELGSQDIL